MSEAQPPEMTASASDAPTVAPVEPTPEEKPNGPRLVPEPSAVVGSPPPSSEPQPVPTVDHARPVETNPGSELLERLRKEIDAATAERGKLEDMRRRAEERDRVVHLRKSGALAALTDEHLLALAPDADPATAEGRAKLNEWRAGNAQLFNVQPVSGKMQTEEMLTNIKESKHGTFGKKLAARLAADLLKD